ncbi:nitroreductase family protein [Desulfosporosinus sp. FKB]|uniref:nitroreductase family protein n=1 Tax=Desulfosporosinus sp. FKB TaxID=1969835 RepID=UPI0032B7792A
MIENDAGLKGSNIRLGTYGVIKGAKLYGVAVGKKGNMDLEDFGYIFESLILYATFLGLGTCWLGGTFKKGEFSKVIGQNNDEILPCITPLGFPARRKSILESAMRFSAGSSKRKDWGELFFQNDFQQDLPCAAAEKYRIPLEMVRLAPSASNKQPWRIVKDQTRYHFYLKHTVGYAKYLAFDLQRVDLGIAMAHFEYSAKELGYVGKWAIRPPEEIDIPPHAEYIVSWDEQ